MRGESEEVFPPVRVVTILTAPVRQAWFAMGHTDLIPSLEAVQGFISAAQYPKKLGVLKPKVIDLEVLRDHKAQAKAA